jgi:beta-galactosidase
MWETEFDASEIPSEGSLLFNALGRDQTVMLNGTPLMEDVPADRAHTEIPLADLIFPPGLNRLTITAKPFTEWRDRENTRERHPAVLRVRKPAEPWHRRVFNGLAQVIVQGSEEHGELTLHAAGEKLQPGRIQITAR